MASLLPGDTKKGGGLALKVGLIIVAIFAGYALLPTIQQWLTQMANEATTFLLNTGPKIALGAALLGFVVRISPLHRSHGGKLIFEGLLCGFGLAIMPRAFTWLTGPAPDLAMNVVNAGGAIVHAVSTGIGGLGG
jgi:hypothetical protein